MTVKELIEFLQTQPQDLPVCYTIHSEQCMLETKDIMIRELCLPRADGWVQNYRRDMPTLKYLCFPGN